MALPPPLDELRYGNETAWRWVVQEYEGPVRSYARRMGHPDPDEVVGATLESVARRMPTFVGGHEELRTFVYSVAHARIVDEFRRRRGRSHVHDRLIAELNTTSPVLSLPPDETSGALSIALRALPASQQEVIRLRHIAGLSTVEVARATGRSMEATRALLSRGLANLRGVLAEPTIADQ